jgi:hypothetical protein
MNSINKANVSYDYILEKYRDMKTNKSSDDNIPDHSLVQLTLLKFFIGYQVDIPQIKCNNNLDDEKQSSGELDSNKTGMQCTS